MGNVEGRHCPLEFPTIPVKHSWSERGYVEAERDQEEGDKENGIGERREPLFQMHSRPVRSPDRSLPRQEKVHLSVDGESKPGDAIARESIDPRRVRAGLSAFWRIGY